MYRRDLLVNLLIRDNQLMELKYKKKKIIFRDTLCYIALPLSEFGSAFGMGDGEKGHFPLLLNRCKKNVPFLRLSIFFDFKRTKYVG